MKKIWYLILCIPIFNSCGQSVSPQNDTSPVRFASKINGLSYVASPRAIDSLTVAKLSSTYANWVSIMPFGFMPSDNVPELLFNEKEQWWGERLDGAKTTIELAHKQQLKVLLKPQIWIGSGAFTGNLTMKNEKDWIKFEEQYANFILAFASLAQDTKTEMLCIGTELEDFIKARPVFWETLISQIKERYTGKLTYAENWDCWNKVAFWEKLDYIGVDAYFPISSEKTPTPKQFSEGWEKHLKALELVSKECKKPILFTEYGYRSADYTAKEPWNFNTSGTMNEQAQYNALQGLYEACWDKDWFAGGFLWKWFPKQENHLGESDTQFSPQGKLAEKLVGEWYRK